MVGYVILWLSSLAAALLFVALVAARESLRKRRWEQIVATVALAPLPLVVGVLATVFAARLRVGGIRHSWLGYCLSWSVIFAVGATLLVVFGVRRRGTPEPVACARGWPWRKLVVGFAAAFVLWAGTLLYTDSVMRLELLEVRAETRALALSVAPPRVPDRRNAAIGYRRAFAAMSDLPSRFRELGDWRNPAFDVRSDEVGRFLHQESSVAELLRRASSTPAYYVETDYARLLATEVPNLVDWHNATNLLALDARSRAAKGDMQGATEDIAAIWGMASHLGSYPGLVACMIAVALEADGWWLVEDVLAAAPAGTDVFGNLDLQPRLSLRDAFCRAWLAEEAYVLSYFPLSYGVAGDASHGIPIVPTIYRVYLFPADLASYRNHIALLRLLARKPYYAAKEEAEELQARFREHLGGTVTAIANPNLSASNLSVAKVEALQRLGLLAIAATEFRCEKGAYPDSLGKLVPGYIPAVPVDPFDGKPLRMVAEGDGLVLYSVGEDGQDDGGDAKGAWIWMREMVDPEGDLAFYVGSAYEERRLKPAREAAERRKAREAR